MNILLVEDDVVVGKAINAMLLRLLHRVTWVTTGEHARAYLVARRPDLLIVDQGLPKMPGTELIKHARALHPGVPAFIVTGNATGIEDHPVLLKPIELEQLREAIKAYAVQ